LGLRLGQEWRQALLLLVLVLVLVLVLLGQEEKEEEDPDLDLGLGLQPGSDLEGWSLQDDLGRLLSIKRPERRPSHEIRLPRLWASSHRSYDSVPIAPTQAHRPLLLLLPLQLLPLRIPTPRDLRDRDSRDRPICRWENGRLR
jgi:hypothetical protein